MRKNLDDVQAQRFIEVLKKLIKGGYLRSLSGLSVEMGNSKSYFADYKRGKSKISMQFADMVADKYPQINMEYILFGTGSPITEQVTPSEQLPTANEPAVYLNSTNNADKPDPELERVRKELNELREQFAVLRYRLELMEKEH